MLAAYTVAKHGHSMRLSLEEAESSAKVLMEYCRFFSVRAGSPRAISLSQYKTTPTVIYGVVSRTAAKYPFSSIDSLPPLAISLFHMSSRDVVRRLGAEGGRMSYQAPGFSHLKKPSAAAASREKTISHASRQSLLWIYNAAFCLLVICIFIEVNG